MLDAHQRENTEPTEKDRAIPISMWVVVGILSIWGVGFYIMNTNEIPNGQNQTVQHQADTTPVIQQEKALAVQKATTEPASREPTTGNTNNEANNEANGKTTSSSLRAINGEAIYASQCQACHQAGGTGIPGVFPPLKDAEWVKGNPHVLAGIILGGYTGKLDVLGQTYNGAMPRFAEKMDDAEAAALITYLRSTLNDESAVDAALVASVRAKIPARPFNNPDDLNTLIKP